MQFYYQKYLNIFSVPYYDKKLLIETRTKFKLREKLT